MANGSVIANLTVKATDAAGNIYINEYVAKTLTINAAAISVSRYTTAVTNAAQGVALDLGDVVTNGVCWLQNTHATAYIDVGVRDGGGTFLPLIRLLAGEAWPIRVTPGVTPYAKASVASAVLKQPIMEA
jgi:hypothetical protein